MPDAAPPAPLPATGRFAVLRRPAFALLFLATGVSTLGTAMISVVLSFALLARGYSASSVGLVMAAETAPAVILLLAGGVVGDRLPRRWVMVCADLLRFACQGALSLLLLHGHPPLAALMGLAGLCGAGTAFHGPAESGLVPQAAGSAHVKDANSLISLSTSLIMVAGPALGGLVMALGGVSLAAGLDAASFALSAGLLSLMPATGAVRSAAAAPASFVADLREGWGEFGRHRWMGLVTVQFGLLNLVAFPTFFLLGAAVFAGRPGGLGTWGLVVSACGAGGVGGGLAMLRWSPGRPLVVVEAAVVLTAMPMALLALGAPGAAVASGAVAMGLGLAALNILIGTAIQESVPDALLSRVSSVIGLAARGLSPVGFALCGPAAQVVGVRGALGGAAVILVASAVAMLGVRDVRDYRARRGAA